MCESCGEPWELRRHWIEIRERYRPRAAAALISDRALARRPSRGPSPARVLALFLPPRLSVPLFLAPFTPSARRSYILTSRLADAIV